jgi:hypothetical protein
MNASCSGPMKRTEQRYLVNEIEVTLVRDKNGARWECGQCRGQCEHILQAVAWMTLQSWATETGERLH